MGVDVNTGCNMIYDPYMQPNLTRCWGLLKSEKAKNTVTHNKKVSLHSNSGMSFGSHSEIKRQKKGLQ